MILPARALRRAQLRTVLTWEIDILVRFNDEPRALAFERYLKSGSGCVFANGIFVDASLRSRRDS